MKFLMLIFPWMILGLIETLFWINYVAKKPTTLFPTIGLSMLYGPFFFIYMLMTLSKDKKKKKQEKASVQNLFRNLEEFKNYKIHDHKIEKDEKNF